MDLNATLLFGAAVTFLVVVSTILLRKNRTRQEERRISESAISYFQDVNVPITVQCVKSQSGFIVLIESEPHKRFRFSYVKEHLLAVHIANATGKQIDKVYWRFRELRKAQAEEIINDYQDHEAPVAAQTPAAMEIGHSIAKDLKSYEVDEASWESYQQAMLACVASGSPFSTAEPRCA